MLPSYATGATRVGGIPACAPVVVIVVLLVSRKLNKACTLEASTLTTDSGWLSMLTEVERWLETQSRKKTAHVELGIVKEYTSRLPRNPNM